MQKTFHQTNLHKKRNRRSWYLSCVLLFLLLTACSTGQTPAAPSSSATKAPGKQAEASPTSTTMPLPTQQTSPGPSPVSSLLAPTPQHCPTAPLPGSTTLSGWGKVIGKGPVWEFGFPPNGTLHLNQYGETPWPVTKIMWPLTPGFPSFVVVRVINLSTGIQAWWDIGQGAPPPNQPVRPLIMNQNPNRVSSQGGWGTLLYLPQAGCYSMQVTWSGGQWRLLFAAGR
jgi:hypothetical protein